MFKPQLILGPPEVWRGYPAYADSGEVNWAPAVAQKAMADKPGKRLYPCDIADSQIHRLAAKPKYNLADTPSVGHPRQTTTTIRDREFL